MEEEVLGYMNVTEQALKDDGVVYEHLDIEDYMERAPVETTTEIVEPTDEKGHGADIEISAEHEKEIVQHELEMLGGSS